MALEKSAGARKAHGNAKSHWENGAGEMALENGDGKPRDLNFFVNPAPNLESATAPSILE